MRHREVVTKLTSLLQHQLNSATTLVFFIYPLLKEISYLKHSLCLHSFIIVQIILLDVHKGVRTQMVHARASRKAIFQTIC